MRVLIRGGSAFLLGLGFILGRKGKQRPHIPNKKSMNMLSDPAEAIHHPDWRVRLHAVRHLADPSDPALLPQWVNMLNDNDSDVRAALVEVIAPYGVRAVPELCAILKKGETSARAAAVSALALIGQAGLDCLIHAAQHDENQAVRQTARQAVTSLQADQPADTLESNHAA